DQINAFHRVLAVTWDAEASLRERLAAQGRLREILRWLWEAAAGPVLTAIGLIGQPKGTWPRVWWATGGMLSLLPVHAAGYHSTTPDPEHRAVLDRVVSSFTPTLSALQYARRRPPSRSAADQTLIVAMPTTPGQQPLPEVAREALLLRDQLPRPELLLDPAPTRAAVLAALEHCTVVHFACHGDSDASDPSRSQLLLSDWEEAPLTVAALAPVNLDQARLAYLSACSTAVTRDTRLLDEAIHLSSAFQLAGFQHVVGTLWPINDNHAVQTAEAFYRRLADEDGLATDQCAQALHNAVRAAREQWPGTVSLWGAYQHSGA
ncbi:CHAT domain-containing protein, partial [Streptomyces sp. MS2.AVA.5]